MEFEFDIEAEAPKSGRRKDQPAEPSSRLRKVLRKVYRLAGALSVIWLVNAYPDMHRRSQERERYEEERRNLSTLGSALLRYRRAHQGALPPKLDALAPTYLTPYELWNAMGREHPKPRFFYPELKPSAAIPPAERVLLVSKPGPPPGQASRPWNDCLIFWADGRVETGGWPQDRLKAQRGGP